MTSKTSYKLLVATLYLCLNLSNIALAEDKNCDLITDKMKKKDCEIKQNIEKKAKKLKENAEKVGNEIKADAVNLKKKAEAATEKYNEMHDAAPKTLVDWFKKLKK